MPRFTPPATDDAGAPVNLLPFVPDSFHPGDGYGWIAEVEAHGWTSIPAWGFEGWDLGAHPYSVVAHYDSPFSTAFGLATYTEGDVTVEAYATREARDAATAELALHLWHFWENGPKNASAPGTPASQIPPSQRVAHRPRLV